MSDLSPNNCPIVGGSSVALPACCSRSFSPRGPPTTCGVSGYANHETSGSIECFDRAVVHEARSYVCEFCGNAIDLRVYPVGARKATYTFCTLESCHWWLEF